MILVSRTIILLSLILVTAVNSGLVYNSHVSENFTLQDEGIPSGKKLRLNDYLITDIIPGSDNRINNQKSEKISYEVKSWNFVQINEIKDTYNEGNHKTLFQSSIFSFRVFSTPDLIYPFNFFG